MLPDRIGNWSHTGQAAAPENNRVFTAIGRAYRSIVNGIASVFHSIVNAIASVFRSIVNGITSVYRGVVNAIASVYRGTVNAIASVYRGIVNAIASVYRGVVNAITSVYRGIVNAVTSAFRAFFGALANLWRKINLAIRDSVRATAQGVGRVFQRLRMSLYRMAFRLRPTTLTLSLENGVVRAVAFKGRNVIAWAVTSLDSPRDQEETEAPAESATEALAGDAGPLGRLLKEMPTGRVRLVTDMPMYAPMIRQLHLPKVAGRYRQQVILSEVLETIPFEPEEVDVSWRLRQDSQSEEAFAVAVPKRSVDDQVRIVKEAGLSPLAAYTKATALAFAIGIPNAIVVHLDRDRVATVLVHESTPQVVHQQEFPWTTTDPQEQADALAAAVDQVAGYYQARSPASDSDPLPVVLTGQMPNETPCWRSCPGYWDVRFFPSLQW